MAKIILMVPCCHFGGERASRWFSSGTARLIFWIYRGFFHSLFLSFHVVKHMKKATKNCFLSHISKLSHLPSNTGSELWCSYVCFSQGFCVRPTLIVFYGSSIPSFVIIQIFTFGHSFCTSSLSCLPFNCIFSCSFGKLWVHCGINHFCNTWLRMHLIWSFVFFTSWLGSSCVNFSLCAKSVVVEL